MRWCRIVGRRKKSYVSLMLATDATDTRRCNKVNMTRAFCRLPSSPHYILLSGGTYELFVYQRAFVCSYNRENETFGRFAPNVPFYICPCTRVEGSREICIKSSFESIQEEKRKGKKRKREKRGRDEYLSGDNIAREVCFEWNFQRTSPITG